MKGSARHIVLETMLLVILARVMLAIVPFRGLVSILSRPATPRVLSEAERSETVSNVHDALLWVWRRGWLRDTCVHRAIAAHLMLRRRGISSQFHYGAATLPVRGLTGHVWLTAGTLPVVGVDQSADYTPLMRWGSDQSGER